MGMLPETETGQPECSVFILFLITLAIFSRLAVDAFTEKKHLASRAARRTSKTIRTRVNDAYNSITSPIWDCLETARDYVADKGLLKSSAVLSWKIAGKALSLALAVAVVVIWSAIWTTFGFTGTWQLLVKIAFIASVFLTFFVVEYT